MKALVLAGGAGTRLRPITHTSAKQLVPVANKPVLFYGLEAIRDAGITDVGIIVGDTARRDRGAVGDGSELGIKVTYIPQEARSGWRTACSSRGTSSATTTSSCTSATTSSSAASPSSSRSFEAASATRRSCSPRSTTRSSSASPCSTTRARSIRLVEKPKEPPSDLALVGVYLFRSGDPRSGAGDQAVSWRGELEITDAIQWLIDARGMRSAATMVTGYWKDTGRLEDMLECNRKVLEGIEPDHSRHRRRATAASSAAWSCEEGASIARSTVRGPAIIGARHQVIDTYVGRSRRSTTRCTVVETEIEHSIVLEHAPIRGVSRIEDSLIGKQVEVSLSDQQPRAHRLMLGDHSVSPCLKVQQILARTSCAFSSPVAPASSARTTSARCCRPVSRLRWTPSVTVSTSSRMPATSPTSSRSRTRRAIGSSTATSSTVRCSTTSCPATTSSSTSLPRRHVDRSIIGARTFVMTNVRRCPDAARRLPARTAYLAWCTSAPTRSTARSTRAVLDRERARCCRTRRTRRPRRAPTCWRGRTHRTYGLNISTTRCSNNYGPYQFPEKVIPLFITNLMDGRKVPLYGDGAQRARLAPRRRPLCAASSSSLEQGEPGESTTSAADDELTNKELTQHLLDAMGAGWDMRRVRRGPQGPRPPLLPGRLQAQRAGVRAAAQLRGGPAAETIHWYRDNEAWWRPLKEKAALKR